MLELIVMVGPSGSGKSYWAQDFVDNNPSTKLVSTDSIRKELFGDESIQRDGYKVFKEAYSRIDEYLNQGFTVVFDATNLRRGDRKRLLKRYKYLNPIFSCHAFLTTFEECMENQEKRERKVSPEVVARQFASYDLPDYNEGWHRLKFHHYIKF